MTRVVIQAINCLFKTLLFLFLVILTVFSCLQARIVMDNDHHLAPMRPLFDDSIVSITTQDGRRVSLNEIRRLQDNNKCYDDHASYPMLSHNHYLEKSESTSIPLFFIQDTSQRTLNDQQRQEVIEQKLRLKGLMPENLGQSNTNQQQIFYVQGSLAYKDSSGNYCFYSSHDNHAYRYKNQTKPPEKFNDLVVVFKTAKKAATAVGKGSKDALRFVGKCIGKTVTKTTNFVVKVVNTVWEGTKWLGKKILSPFIKFKKKHKQESPPISSETHADNTAESESPELTTDNLATSDVLCVIAFNDSHSIEHNDDQQQMSLEKQKYQEPLFTQPGQEELTISDGQWHSEQKNKHLRTLLDQSLKQYLQDDTFDFLHSHRLVQGFQDPLFLHKLGHKFLDQALQASQDGDHEREALLTQRAESLIQTLEDSAYLLNNVSEEHDDQCNFNLGSLYNNDDPYEEIFSTYRNTPIDKQLHTELMSTLRQTSESILVFDNVYAHTTAPAIYHGAALAKCQTNPEASFHLADFCQSMLRYTQHIVRFIAGYTSGYVAAPFIDAHEWVTHPLRSAFNAAVGFLGQAALMLAQAAYAYVQDPEDFKNQCSDFCQNIQNAGAFQIGFFIGGLQGADPVSKAARMKFNSLKSNDIFNAAMKQQQKLTNSVEQIKNRLQKSNELQSIQQSDIDKVTQPLKTVFSKADEYKRQVAEIMTYKKLSELLKQATMLSEHQQKVDLANGLRVIFRRDIEKHAHTLPKKYGYGDQLVDQGKRT